MEKLRTDLITAPFQAPGSRRLEELGLGNRQLAAAERVGALLRITKDIVLLPDANEQASRLLAAAPQPFTTSQARQILQTTRRVAVPLLECLDDRGITRRLPDHSRRIGPVVALSDNSTVPRY